MKHTFGLGGVDVGADRPGKKMLEIPQNPTLVAIKLQLVGLIVSGWGGAGVQGLVLQGGWFAESYGPKG